MPAKTLASKSSLKLWAKRSALGRVSYGTKLGVSLVGDSQTVLKRARGKGLGGKVQLIFTSPPFPLNRKKKYGNREGDEFKQWLAGYATLLRDLLTEDGSIVMEMGNAWEPGMPVMSTLAVESLLAVRSRCTPSITA